MPMSAFSAGLLGAAVGALTFGPLGDRFGRKRMLVAAALLLSVFTLLTSVATTFPEVLLIRFLAGIGLGGATPCFITLSAEYAPKRQRAMLTSVLWVAYPLGASLGGVLRNLFTEGRARSTLLLWGLFLTAFGSTTIAVLLMPTLFRVSGLSLSAGALLVGLFNLPSTAALPRAGLVRITRPLDEEWACRPQVPCTRDPAALPAATRVLVPQLVGAIPARPCPETTAQGRTGDGTTCSG